MNKGISIWPYLYSLVTCGNTSLFSYNYHCYTDSYYSEKLSYCFSLLLLLSIFYIYCVCDIGFAACIYFFNYGLLLFTNALRHMMDACCAMQFILCVRSVLCLFTYLLSYICPCRQATDTANNIFIQLSMYLVLTVITNGIQHLEAYQLCPFKTI